MAYLPGDFSFLDDDYRREMLEDAYNAVTVTNSWPLMGNDPGDTGFTYSNAAYIKTINKEIKFDGHSGSSYGWTMRQMQWIAQIGWMSYVSEKLKAKALNK